MIRVIPGTRRWPGARGRSALISGAATFVLVQVGLAVAIDCWLPEVRSPAFTDKARALAGAAAAGHRPVVVMLGSSRVQDALRGRVAAATLAGPDGGRPVVFNFGISGAGPLLERIVLRRLLRDGVRPTLVLIEVLPAALSITPSGYFEAWLDPTRLALGELPLAFEGPALARARRRWLKATLVPCYRYRRNLLTLCAPQFLLDCVPGLARDALDEHGNPPEVNVDWSPSAEEYRRGVVIARSEHAPFLTDFKIGGPGPAALRDVLATCRDAGIPARLVMMPEGSSFRALYPPAVWPELERFLDGLARDYEAPLINARDWLADGDFRDGHHAVPQGAVRFSERLAREHLRPLLAGGSADPAARPWPIRTPPVTIKANR